MGLTVILGYCKRNICNILAKFYCVLSDSMTIAYSAGTLSKPWIHSKRNYMYVHMYMYVWMYLCMYVSM